MIDTSPSSIRTFAIIVLGVICGFDEQPFAVGDQVYVEGIQRVGEVSIGATQGGISTNTTVEGTGYNSDDYNYSFF